MKFNLALFALLGSTLAAPITQHGAEVSRKHRRGLISDFGKVKLGNKSLAAFGATLGTIGGWSGPVFNRWLTDKYGVQTPATTSNPNDRRKKRDVPSSPETSDIYDWKAKRDALPIGPKGVEAFKALLGTVGGLSGPIWIRMLNNKNGAQTPARTSNPNDKRDALGPELEPKGVNALKAAISTGFQTPASTSNPNYKRDSLNLELGSMGLAAPGVNFVRRANPSYDLKSE